MNHSDNTQKHKYMVDFTSFVHVSTTVLSLGKGSPSSSSLELVSRPSSREYDLGSFRSRSLIPVFSCLGTGGVFIGGGVSGLSLGFDSGFDFFTLNGWYIFLTLYWYVRPSSLTGSASSTSRDIIPGTKR